MRRTVVDKRVNPNSALRDSAKAAFVEKRVEVNSALGDGAQADTRYVGEQATLCGTARLARTRIAPLTDVIRQPRSQRAES